MNSKKIVRIVLDTALTIMIIVEMFIQFTGVFLHEVIGFAFFATVIAHVVLSAKWIKNTASTASKGKMTARRTALAVMGILLAVNVVVLGVSSVAISSILESAGFTWTLGSYATWKAVHAASSYTLCALVAIHLGMHWAFLASAFRVPYDPSRRRAISTGVHAAAAVGALALGVMAVNKIAPLNSENTSSSGNGTATQAREGNMFGSVNDSAGNSSSSSSASSSSSSSNSSGPHHGGRDRDGMSSSSASPSSSSSSSSASPSGSSAQNSTPSQSGGSAGSASGQSGTDTSSSASGICTLCHKECPLSDPKCDKPYRQGLL